ncbi:flagellar hook-basal body complex protein [Bacillota bacterium LX-D]|nr:flagellar hook-basal body complex protein [Bacillota bacterium LX-D]
MIRGIYTAATGMLVQDIKQDLITNNIANINTPGYKKSEVSVSSFPQVLLSKIDGEKGSQNGSKPIGAYSNGVMIDREVIDWQNGSLEETGNNSDLALLGTGFFTLQTAQGVRYSQNGSFKVDGQGYLVNNQGDYVLGTNGRILVGENNFKVDPNGAVTVDGTNVDYLRITNFTDPSYLTRQGSDLYTAINQAQARNLAPEEVQIKQGFIEKPNFNLVNEMVNMIMVMRSYESGQKTIQAQDEILGKSVNDIASVR